MSEPIPAKPIPRANPETQPYWDACADGRLTLQQCRACAQYQFYPRMLCSHCGARELDWRDAAGSATLRTFTIIRRAVSSAFDADAPYVVALVQLSEGPTMMTNIVGCDPEALQIGQALRVVFEPRGTTQVPQFTPA